jgi:wyosine [tRNA(Phe)-imidazoG37] synthetase (radical SAM superfamily)
VLAELKDFLSSHSTPDYVTLSGAGEPTLHARLGDIVQGVKRLTKVPLAVITNGSLFWDATVRDALRDADVVLPSLDAGNARLFQYINRPATGISFEQMVTGLIAFRKSFRNALWLEVMLLAGVTSGESEVGEIAEWVGRIQPDRVQLNTVVRPPAERFALPILREHLELLAMSFDPCAEVIADYCGQSQEAHTSPDAARVLELLERRPCSVREIAATLGLRPIETTKLIELLVRQKKIAERRFRNDIFFSTIHEDERAIR